PNRNFRITVAHGGIDYSFQGKILNPAERRMVDVRVGQKFPGLAFEQIPLETFNWTRICETLNKAILTLPPELGVEKINDWD
ncbi:hypothetical protein, partial [Leptospira levettii]|uniref:hypothetical protein n=1 Tax=Leptospira levettii TaxID=2023178 RepID=UPI000CBF2E42